jgi:PAS domain S-box-containing protein
VTRNFNETNIPRELSPRSAELFRAACEQATISIQIFSPDGKTIWVNRAWEKLWGVTLEGVGDYNVLSDAQLVEKGIMPFIEKAFSGEPSEIPAIFYDPEETLPNLTVNKEPGRWVRAFAFPVKDERERICEVVLMHEDITERKRAEEAARRWAEVFERVQWGVVTGSGDGSKLLMMNPAYAQMHGYTVEELINRPIRDVFAPEYREKLVEQIRTTRERGHFTYESVHIRKDGTVFPVSVESTAIKDDDGNILYLAAHVQDITEQKKIENELRDSEEKYRGLLENANDIVYSHDLQGKYLTINRAGEKITGYSREEILGGLNIAQVVAPEHLELAREMIARKLRDPSPTVYELDIISKDGKRLTLELSTRISRREGHPVAVEGIARDITERKRAEAELQKSKKQIEIILQGVAESITAQDATGRLVYANDAAAKTLGLPSAQDLMETPVQILLDRFEILDETRKAFPPEQLPGRIALREGKSAEATICYRSKETGEERWTAIKSTPVFDKDGQVQFAINIFQDITERRRTEQAQKFLAEASEVINSSLDYTTTLASLAQKVVPTLADWCAVDVIEEDHSLKRLAVAHVDPRKVEWAYELQKRYPPDMNASLGVPNVLRTGKSEIYPEIKDEMLVAAARDDEHLQIMRDIGFTSAIIVPLIAHGRTLGAITFITAESKRIYGREDLAVAENLAHRAAVAIDNARLYRSAQEANRLKDEFLATLSHELRTPLTAILGWSNLLRTGKIQNLNAASGLEAIERNARAQSKLIDDLLDVSRIITGKLRIESKQINPVSFIEAALESLRPAAEAKGVDVNLIPDSDICPVSGDPARLQQVIWNILSNALKFTPKGGRIQVRVGRADSQIEIAISDTGAGIKPEFLPHVFDRFRQADQSSTRHHGGLGLGLAIVRHLVELHGGTVHAESAGEGKGATFVVRLPVSDAHQEEDVFEGVRPSVNEMPSVKLYQDRLDDIKILLVDDEADTREMLKIALGQCGAETTEAGSAQEAIEILKEIKFDILISDIGMPGADGYELIKRVRTLSADKGGKLPAIALTAYARLEDRLRALRSGFQMHVPKPVELDELVATINALVQRTQSN